MKDKTMNRVWIELDKPRDKAHAEQVCRLANKMLGRLVGPREEGVEHSQFFWSDSEKRYCYGGNFGYRSLTDRGEWFNLDYFGRD